MAEVKLTKSELRAQQRLLAQLQKYLPTLQLKSYVGRWKSMKRA